MSDKKILIADDDNGVLEFLEDFLGSENYKLSLNTNGSLLLEKYKENPNDVGLVITDWHMPIKGGKEVCENLKELGYKGNIIVMSATGKENDILNFGVKHFIKKPFAEDKGVAYFLEMVKDLYKG